MKVPLVTKPTLLIDRAKVSANIHRMAEKAAKSRVTFRPHFKTHQSENIANHFRDHDVDKITVSSVSMAAFFASHGWRDITIAFPANLKEVLKVDELAEHITLNLLVDSLFTTRHLDKLLTKDLGIFIEIDNGYHRSGLLPGHIDVIDSIIRYLDHSKHLHFRGFLTHAGNTYAAKGKAAIMEIMDDAAAKLDTLKSRYISKYPDMITSYGDTPSCSMADDLSAFDEVRPGNFVYYDVMQYHIGSCTLQDIAVAVGCPVVSVYPERNEMIIYGGAVHLSKEFISGDKGFRLFGYIVDLTKKGWEAPIPGAYVSSISQEHGIVKMPDEHINRYKPGDIVGVLPIHSCLTADLLVQQSVLL